MVLGRVRFRSRHGNGVSLSDSNREVRIGTWWDQLVVRLIFAGACVAAPREGVRAVAAVTGRHVRVTVGGVIYQIYREALEAGQDVLCMHTAGADTTRLVSAGSSRACAEVTIGRQDRDEPATNILAANQPADAEHLDCRGNAGRLAGRARGFRPPFELFAGRRGGSAAPAGRPLHAAEHR